MRSSVCWRGLICLITIFALPMVAISTRIALADDDSTAPLGTPAEIVLSPTEQLPARPTDPDSAVILTLVASTSTEVSPTEATTDALPTATDLPPTESIATLVPTLEPPIATDVSTPNIPTDIPLTEPDTSPTEGPPAPLQSTADLSPTPTPVGVEQHVARMIVAAASSDTSLTVNGQKDTAYVPYQGVQTFEVGDLLDMSGSGYALIEASNPDPDFYRFNGWWTGNEFLVFAGRDCQGHFVHDLVTGNMQPDFSSASTTFSGEDRTYSVQATQWLSVWWIEKSIDIVDTVDETTVFPAVATSNCVNVEMAQNDVQLVANGSTGPISISEGDPIGLQTNRPTINGWSQQILESTTGCNLGALLVDGPSNNSVSANITRSPGSYWFTLRLVRGSDTLYGNCVHVTVQDIRAELRVNGSTDIGVFITGQTVPLYVTGFTPRIRVIGLVYVDSVDCSSSSLVLTSGSVDAYGTLDTTTPLPFATNTISIRFNSSDGPAESTNCVALTRSDSDIRLTVNGSTGPVLVESGEIHLLATGLPPGSDAYAARTCEGPFHPEDYGQPIGPNGIFEAYMSDNLPDMFEARVVLGPDFTISSNCVLVQLVEYSIDPRITVNGSQTPNPVAIGDPIAIAGLAFPPDTAITIRIVAESADCTGPAMVDGAQSDREGAFSLDRVAEEAGVISFRAEAGHWTSNCVSLQVTAASAPPTVIPDISPAATIPAGPITLYANGQTEPQTLASGAIASFTADGLGERESYQLAWYQSRDCSGTARSLGNGVAGARQVGTMTRYVASTIGVRLTAENRMSNCVQVNWLAAPSTIIPPTDPDPDPDPGVTMPPTDPDPDPDPGVTAPPTDPDPDPDPDPGVTMPPTDPDPDPDPAPSVTMPPTGTTSAVTAPPVPTATASAGPTGRQVSGISPTHGPVTGMPVAGGSPTDRSSPWLTAMLSTMAGLTFCLAAAVVRRGARR